MKKSLLFIGTLIFATYTIAQEIKFEKSTWAEIKTKAKEQHKLIFVDAYTTWCGPCKAMAKKTFTDAEVASYYNEHFINAKIDMEKGEGPEIGKQYLVNCYPNLLFIDGDGNLVHRSAGFLEAKEFLLLGKEAQTPEKTFSSIQKQFAANNTNPIFARDYFNLLSGSCLSANDEAIKYLKSLKESEITQRDNWEIIRDYVEDAQSSPFSFLVRNREEFIKQYAADSVNAKIFNTYLHHSYKFIREKNFDTSKVIALVKEIQNTNFDRSEELLLSIDLSYYERLENWDAFYRAANTLAKKFKQNDAMFLNYVSWTIFEKSNDKTQLAEGELWAKRSVEIKEAAFNLDTYANLLFKNGKTEEAILAEKKAIELTKAAGEDTSDFEKTLSGFKRKK